MPDSPRRPTEGVTPATPGWRLVSIGFESDAAEVSPGLNAWDTNWKSADRKIVVAHPDYPTQRDLADVYEVAGSDPPILFAAAEFSNGVWGFFVPDGSG